MLKSLRDEKGVVKYSYFDYLVNNYISEDSTSLLFIYGHVIHRVFNWLNVVLNYVLTNTNIKKNNVEKGHIIFIFILFSNIR